MSPTPNAFPLLVVAALTGCAAGPEAPALTAGPRPDAGEVMRRLVNIDNGLQVRRWTVADDSAVIGAALSRYQQGEVLSGAQADVMRRDGLRLVRIRADTIEALLGEMGQAPIDVSAWHGQALTWRELLGQPIGPQGIALAVGGRVRRFEPGRLRLMARSWTVPMEDGPYLNLELLPQHTHRGGHSLQRLLGSTSLQGEVLKGAALQLLLEADDAYILLSESPQVRWSGPEANLDEDVTATPGGPHARFGPEVAGPVTLGQFLMDARTEPPMRTMLIFVPRLPPQLWQPYDMAASEMAPQKGPTGAVGQ